MKARNKFKGQFFSESGRKMMLRQRFFKRKNSKLKDRTKNYYSHYHQKKKFSKNLYPNRDKFIRTLKTN